MILPTEVTKSKTALAEYATRYAQCFEQQLRLEAKTKVEAKQIITDPEEAIETLRFNGALSNYEELRRLEIYDVYDLCAFTCKGNIYIPVKPIGKRTILDSLEGERGIVQTIRDWFKYKEVVGFSAEVGHVVFDQHFPKKQLFCETFDILSSILGITWNASQLRDIEKKEVDLKKIKERMSYIENTTLFSAGYTGDLLTRGRSYEKEVKYSAIHPKRISDLTDIFLDLMSSRHFEGALVFTAAYSAAKGNITEIGQKIVSILRNQKINTVVEALEFLDFGDSQKYEPFICNDMLRKRLALKDFYVELGEEISGRIQSNSVN